MMTIRTVDNDESVEIRVCPNCGQQFVVDKYPVSWLEYIYGTKYQYQKYGYYCRGICCWCNEFYEEVPVI